MTKPTTPLRQRMIEDMAIRNMSPLTQAAYVRAVANFAIHHGVSPDKLTFEDVRKYQVHLSGAASRSRRSSRSCASCGSSTDVNVADSGGVQQFWFVKLGVMYEVLGIEGDEAWLIDILKTWQFD